MAWPRGLLPSCSCSQGDAYSLEPECREPNPPALCQPLVWSCPEEQAQTTGSEKIRKGTWKGLADLDQHERVQGHVTKAGCPVHTVTVLSPGQRRKPTKSSCPQQSPLPRPILLFLSLQGQKGAKRRAVSSPLEGTSLTSLSLFPHLQSEGNETSFL